MGFNFQKTVTPPPPPPKRILTTDFVVQTECNNDLP